MKNRSWTNEAQRGVHGAQSSAPELSAAPTTERAAVTSCSGPAHIEIPPQLRKPAAVAAPRARRSPANGHTVQNAEAAPPKRKAGRPRLDSVPVSRENSPQADCSETVRGNGRLAAVYENGEMASLASCLAVVPEGGRSAVPHEGNCSAIVRGEAVAASDDVHGKTAAGTKSMDEGRASQPFNGCQKIRKTCADAALSLQKAVSEQKEDPIPRGTSTQSDEKALAQVEKLKVPTDPEALADGPAYVRAVALHVDLVGASARLVVSQDEKVSKAELDRLRELIFGKGGPPPTEEVLRIDWEGIPRPDREHKKLDGTPGGERGDN